MTDPWVELAELLDEAIEHIRVLTADDPPTTSENFCFYCDRCAYEECGPDCARVKARAFLARAEIAGRGAGDVA